MTDEIQKSPVDRMAKARAARAANKTERDKYYAEKKAANKETSDHLAAYREAGGPADFPELPTRQVKKPPIIERDEARADARDRVSRTSNGRLEVTGRDGEVLSRTRVQVGDPFDIPQHMIPAGWSYQWNAVSIAGNSEILLDQNHHMYLNGWRAVPAERYAGTLLPKGSKGNIIRGQQMLVERPVELTKEAQEEDVRNAKQLISDRNESLKLAGVNKSMPDGFKGRNDVSGIRMQIDKSLDVVEVNRQSGNYQLDE